MKHLLSCLVALACLGPLAACGGGGGGDGDVEGDAGVAPQILGPYHYFEFVTASTFFRFTEVGPIQVDDFGILSGDTQRYFTFLTSPEGVSPSRVLVDAPDGSLSNTSDEPGGELIREGGLGAGNHLALLAGVDDLPNLLLLSQPDASTDAGDLAGLYHFTLFSPSDGASTWGRVDFDGGGNGTLPAVAQENVNGSLGDSEVSALSVQVQPGGGAVLSVSPQSGPDLAFEGVATDGGRLLLASRTDSDGVAKPFVLGAVRAAQGADEGLLAGRYWFALLLAAENASLSTMEFISVVGTLDADGAGGCVLNGTSNDMGSFQDLDGFVGTYSVAPDGSLVMVLPDLGLIGGLDPSGRYAVLGGSHASGLPAHFAMLVRQPTTN